MRLEDLFTAQFAAPRLRSSLLGPWLDSFVDRLSSVGYTRGYCLSCARFGADLGRWMAEHGFAAECLDESSVATFVADRGAQRDRRREACTLLLAHLRTEGVVSPRLVPADDTAIAVHAREYASYMRGERGAAEGTVEGYVSVVREFLQHRFGAGDVSFAAVTGADIGEYLVGRAPRLSQKRVAYLACALRSFFRFLFIRGQTGRDLSGATLTPQTRDRASVPQYLSPEEVERLLGTCDPGTPAGRRNRAILLLLARLGLRASEVAGLELEDLRWRSGEIVVRGKGNLVDRLPLLPEVGNALAEYLTRDRPAASGSRRVFLRLSAPLSQLSGRGAIGFVVRRSIGRAGLQPARRGPHLLRHTLATRLLRAGASMTEIAEVLRHHDASSTAIYAKVDFEALRTLAQPWPNAGGAR